MSRRLTACVLLFGLSALAVTTQQAAPAGAVQKNQVLQLQQQLQQAANLNAQLKAENAQLKADLKAAKKDSTDTTKTAKKDEKSAKTILDTYKNAGLVHVVLLKLKSDSKDEDADATIDDAKAKLAKIKAVRGMWAGKPSEMGTKDIAKTDYSVALVMLFDDADALQKYIDDDAHTKFVDKHLKKYEKPVVYDFEPAKKAAP